MFLVRESMVLVRESMVLVRESMVLVRESMVLVRESMVLVRENMFLIRETYFSYIFRYSIFFKYSSKNTSISFSINAFGTECFAFWHRMYFKNRVDADALNQSPFLSLWFQFSIPHVLVSSPFVVCSAVRMADEDNRSEMNGGPVIAWRSRRGENCVPPVEGLPMLRQRAQMPVC